MFDVLEKACVRERDIGNKDQIRGEIKGILHFNHTLPNTTNRQVAHHVGS